MAQTQQIIRLYSDGMIREPEMRRRLGALKIRGSWANGIYTGYDYANQQWLRFDHRGEQVAA